MISINAIASLLQDVSVYILPLVLAVLYLFFNKWRQRKMTEDLSSFYSKSSLPFIGHVHHVTGTMTGCVEKVFKLLAEWRFPAVAWIFHIPVVIVATPEDMQTILNTSNDRGLLKKCKKSFGDGILVSTGNRWRKSRRLISTVFSSSHLHNYTIAFNQYAIKLCEKIEPFAHTNKEIDLWTDLQNMNIDIIFDNMANYKTESLEKGNDDYAKIVEGGQDIDSRRYIQPLLYFDFVYDIFLYITGKWRLFEKRDQLYRKIVDMKIHEQEQNRSLEKGDSEIKQQSLLDVLTNAFHTDANFTEDCIQDDLSNTIPAGSVTTARTTSFTLIMLAMHQDIQEKVYQEIESILGNSTGHVEMHDMNKLVYLDQCIKETLRKFPLIPITFRKHPQEIKLNDKYTIPANCHMVLSIYSLHHDEHIYPNPQVWDPDRFTQEAIVERHAYSFLPFGKGPRTCIGYKYAMLSMKTVLVHLLRSYRFTTDIKMDEIRLDMNIVLKCENGLLMKIWRRKN